MELLVTLDPADRVPLHAQLERALREDVRAGRLRPGARLPSTRRLAAQLGVSRGVVVEAYAQLHAEGYLATRRGSGTHVAHAAAAPAAARGDAPAPRPRYTFHPGQPDLSAFPRTAWLAATRRALHALPDQDLGYGTVRGPRVLREALAEHLGRTRGTAADPQRMLVCSGLIQGFTLAFAALRDAGATRIALEDPGWLGHRTVAAHTGLEAVPIPVDDHGMRVDLLDEARVDAVVVTPAHQSPMGAVLAPDRRAALLGWAQRTGGLIVEDDYDAEYRYDREPVGALQGLDPDHVLYAGSASKILAPALRLGWLVAPLALSRALVEHKRHADLGTPLIEQLALAEFVESGELERHLRRTRRRYRARRDALLDALARHLPGVRVQGVAAGLHAVVLLPEGTDEHALVAAAGARGIEIHGLGDQRFEPAGGPPGLILGYAAMPEPAIAAAIAELAELMPR
ncbi:MocR-like pyridoxine biosynthesis transcription factor PdxR [Capillimicrobium parvum]|uniref:HTH-type transcriptional regulatory protein GabR n=1 Tax=Capillimicrobium parvum TaxID=2884022 RepID=A0A9E6Y2Y7_9ACTN|nr:PLP-dependent aminotransferase family protein [Capillimicrobium parvum]UGS39249.1 HTH-type transcriptional regulatory protein GabR [Capillimicrobium parvum]